MGKAKKIVHKIKRFVLRLLGFFMKPCILFESRPPFSDNTRAVFDEFVRRGFEKRYHLIWYLDDDTCASLIGNKPVFWDPKERKTIRQKLRNHLLYSKTKAIICCNRFLPSSGWACPVDQNICKSFYLSHGTPIKRVDGYYFAPDGIDYSLSPSENLIPLMARAFHIDPAKFFVSGFPRNDMLVRRPISLCERIGQDINKIIVWYPTFRQHQKATVAPAGGFAMPLIHEKAYAKMLNEAAKKTHTLILFKPHFVQDPTLLDELELSHIQIISDEFFARYGITSYELLACSDALITDYSSVYFDYLLCDKPIAVVWEDIEEYKKNPGFVIDLDEYLRGAEKIYTIDQLCRFVEDVASGNDHRRTDRREIRDLTNAYRDDQNSKRVVDFIISRANL